MDIDCSTDSLRSLACQWTLAGDDKLLEILQNTHKRIVSKCQDVNEKLIEMSTALDEASVSFQCANNRFMALSNSQFIESRVYDDDYVTKEVPTANETPVASQKTLAEEIKTSLSILESMHETVTIHRESDTESDTDDEDIVRMVLKPKDMYRDRPLPYIIGSEQWKNKWHAGLIVEDSDTDSCTSKADGPSSEYSESEEESIPPRPGNQVYEKEERQVEDLPRNVEMKPADVAAEIARRLTANAPPVTETEEQYSSPAQAVKTVYKPQQPPTGVIFSDEPPPVIFYGSESSDDEDIFSELHRNEKPYTKNEEVKSTITDEVFGVTTKEAIFESLYEKPAPKSSITPETNVRNPVVDGKTNVTINQEIVEKGSKKPVGGISVFGSSKGADSIGAAIMKRNIRKESTSDEDGDSNQQHTPVKNTANTDLDKKEKDIFDDLFTKPKVAVKKNKETVANNSTQKVKEDVKKDTQKVDLFSDDIFDDIDDIFSSNVIQIPKKDSKINKQSIFDDDIDLFADVAEVGPSKVSNTSKTEEKKGLFDSDDDLFDDRPPKKDAKSYAFESQTSNKVSTDNITNTNKSAIINNSFNKDSASIDVTKSSSNTYDTIIDKSIKKSTKLKETKSIFDSDSDSEIFASIPTSKHKNDGISKTIKPGHDISTNISDSSNINIEFDSPAPQLRDATHISENNLLRTTDVVPQKSPSIFDEEDERLFGIVDVIKSDIVKGADKNTNSEFESLDSDNIIENEQEIDINAKQSETKQISEYNEGATIDTSKISTISRDEAINNKFDDIDFPKSIENSNIPENVTDNVIDEFIPEEIGSSQDKNIFGEILSEPPVFEKPKESKKSKNVNALFDDDSDDEALFFRKSDVMDEIPENVASNIIHDPGFRLFHDEPPAIDVNFGIKNDNPGEDSFTDLFDPNLNPATSKDLLEKPTLKGTRLTETPCSDELIRSHDFSDHKDIFSSIGSENIFVLPNDVKESNGKTINVGNNFDEFNPEGDKLTIEELREKTDKVDVSQVISSDSNRIVNTVDEPDDLFSSLSMPAKLNVQIVPPAVPDFDNIDEELFQPTISKNTESNESTYPEYDIFSAAQDSNTGFSNKKTGNDVKDLKIDNKLKNNAKILDTDTRNLIINTNMQENNTLGFFSNIEKNTANLGINFDSKTQDSTDRELNKESDTKKVGKLKTMNLNIDVATLLPGASPKKQNKLQTSTSTFTSEDNHEKVENEFKQETETIVKSVSFEGEPNSDILDNKLSKERAKIQVKRRPSTRRARKEAVRKSVIDLEDSTDNSSSIDDPPKATNLDITSDEIKKLDATSADISENRQKSVASIQKQETKITKVVYVLNDDDIFNTEPKMSNLDTNEEKNIDSRYTTRTEIVEPKTTKSDKHIRKTEFGGINTIGKVYQTSNDEVKAKKNKENEQKVTKSSLFGEETDDDDELFSKDKSHKQSIFYSGDKNELFSVKKKEKQRKVEVKSSLFGDDDDDDLFAVKTTSKFDTKSSVSKAQVSKELPKTTEPVFDDPLSMLGDDE